MHGPGKMGGIRISKTRHARLLYRCPQCAVIMPWPKVFRLAGQSRPSLAIFMVEIPRAASWFLVCHQDIVFGTHLPVKMFHQPFLSPFEELARLSSLRIKMLTVKYLTTQSTVLNKSMQLLIKAIFIRRLILKFFGAIGICQHFNICRERMLILGIINRQIVNAMAGCLQLAG